MTVPAPGWPGLREHGNFRGWVISVLAIMIATLVIVAIGKWGHPPTPSPTVQPDD